ncbi:MAG: ABC transporter permease [Bacteroidetes bacterium]|nr:ABC transporter permease [Bacteroidota bacterium]
MSTAFDIAKKISFHQKKSYTSIIVKLSIIATAISVAAIILTLSLVNGFQQSISNKVYSFWGHIRIESVNGSPLQKNDSIVNSLLKASNQKIQSITPFVSQSTVISFKQDIEGIVALGVNANDPIPFLVKGDKLTPSKDSLMKEIIISDGIAKKLNIPLNENIKLYFINGTNVQQRKFKVVGFYHSGMQDYDQQYVMIDIKSLQQLRNNFTEVDGYTVTLKDAEFIDAQKDIIQAQLPHNWVSTTIPNYYPQIFDWIGVQTINRNVAITIMLIIAIVNLITCLFILMLERVSMIGTLTAMGASNGFIRQVFIYQASIICWSGIILGSILGLGLSLLQKYFGWIQLDETAYFIKTLPIKIVPTQIVILLFGTALISYISFLLPTLWIKRISPAAAIRFD